MPLPSYRAEHLAQASAPLLPQSQNNAAAADERGSFESTSDSLPGYPPSGAGSAAAEAYAQGTGHSGVAKGAGLVAMQAERCSNAIFMFEPRYPIKADAKSVYARISDDKLETTIRLQQHIPFLASFAPDQIEYSVPRHAEPGGSWVPLMDDAWPVFAREAPKWLRVQVVEQPEQTRQRGFSIHPA